MVFGHLLSLSQTFRHVSWEKAKIAKNSDLDFLRLKNTAGSGKFREVVSAKTHESFYLYGRSLQVLFTQSEHC